MKREIPNGTSSISSSRVERSPSSGLKTSVTAGIPNYMFAEKLVPLLVDLFLQAPAVQKYILYSEIIQSLGRY